MQSQLQQLTSTIPSSLKQLTSPVSAATNAATNPGGLGGILDFLDGADGNPIGTFLNSNFLNGFTSAGYVNPAIITPAVTSGLADVNSLGPNGVPMPGGEGVTSMIKPLTPAPVSVPKWKML